MKPRSVAGWFSRYFLAVSSQRMLAWSVRVP